jgi:hypothetical protein
MAQVLLLPPSYEIDDIETGHNIAQLKRALRGAAFARGALLLLRADELLDEEAFQQFMLEADSIASQIIELLRMVRESPR